MAIQFLSNVAVDTNVLFVDTINNRVGIGTASPATKLHIADVTTPTIRIEDTTNNRHLQLFHDNNNSYIRSSTGSQLRFQTNGGNDRVVITTSGEVGIGTDSPAFKTTIYSDSTTDSFPLVVGQPSSGNEFVGIGLSGFVANNGAVKAGFVLDRKSTFGVGDIHILSNTTTDNTNATLADSKFTILQNSNVGIGTPTPSEKLTISSDNPIVRIHDSSSTTRYAAVNFATAGGSWFLSSGDNETSGTSSNLFITRGNDGTSNRFIFHRDSYYFGVYDNTNTIKTVIRANGNSYFNGGNVGIGTSSPSQKLDVNGNIELAQYGYIYFGSNSSNQLLLSNSLSGSQITQSGSGNLDLQSASNDIHLKAGGLTKAVVRASGNVGVGITGPTNKLHVRGATGILKVDTGSDETWLEMRPDSNRSFNIGDIESEYSGAMITGWTSKDVIEVDANLGVGTSNPNTKLEVGLCSSSGNIGDGNIAVKTNTNNTAIVMQEASGAEQWGLGVNSDGDFVLTDSGTERVRIDDNTGNFGIGTNAPAEKLVVSGSEDVSVRINSTRNTTWTADQLLGAYEFFGNDASGAGAQIKAKIDCASVNTFGAGFSMRFFTTTGSTGTSAQERMRIRHDGIVLIGKTSSSSNTAGIELNPVGLATLTRSGNLPLLVNRTTNDGTLVSFRRSNSQKGSISISGSTTSYNTSSDYRLKENVVDMTGAIDRIEQLQPKRFNFISNTQKTVDGFIAHEVQNIIPEAVLGEKDAVDENGEPEYQEMDNSKIVPLLVGAIKELKAEIENLKIQINS